jgi:hypothetical protein
MENKEKTCLACGKVFNFYRWKVGFNEEVIVPSNKKGVLPKWKTVYTEQLFHCSPELMRSGSCGKQRRKVERIGLF